MVSLWKERALGNKELTVSFLTLEGERHKQVFFGTASSLFEG
jgi:hypothetical protein